jgi:hypothetical protein
MQVLAVWRMGGEGLAQRETNGTGNVVCVCVCVWREGRCLSKIAI